jgi:Raf kinase inhibitor-like YbhB/YbcL family protein
MHDRRVASAVRVARSFALALVVATVVAAGTGCSGGTPTHPELPPGSRPSNMAPAGGLAPMPGIRLGSPAFVAGGEMPRRYGATGIEGGKNESPFLSWAGTAPAGTRSWALAMVDTTTPGKGFVHWLVLDIPLSAKGLPPGASGTAQMPAGSVELRNDAGSSGYAGPEPPSGTHVYRFVLYAMPDDRSYIPAGADKQAFFARVINGLGASALEGRFTR